MRAPRLNGVVTDPSGAPVAGAQVSLYLPEDGLYSWRSAVTAADGTYSFPSVAAGTYKAVFRPPAGSGLRTEWFNDAATRASGSEITLVARTSFWASAQLAAK